MQRSTSKTMSGVRLRRRTLFAFLALIIVHFFFNYDLKVEITAKSHTDPKPSWSDPPGSEPPKSVGGREQQNKQDSPIWSASTRLNHKNVSEFDASFRWRKVGDSKIVSIDRSANEVLAYGIGGVLPYFGNILPAIRFDSPFHNETQVEIAHVEGLVDSTLDIHQCRFGRDGNNDPDGYYDACFARAPGRDATKSLCFDKHRNKESRIHGFPAPGHERWICSDKVVMEQYLAAQVLDYFISHGDRFFREMTNNLFFFSDQRPAKFVSIDHHGDPVSMFNTRNFEAYVVGHGQKYLLNFELPSQLRDEIRSLVKLGSKDDFSRKFNSAIDGQVYNLNRIFHELHDKKALRHGDPPQKILPLLDILWLRLESVTEYYNII